MNNPFPNFCIQTTADKLNNYFCGITVDGIPYAFDIKEKTEDGIAIISSNWKSFVEPFITQMQSAALQAKNITACKPLSLNTTSLIEVVKANGYGCDGQATFYQLGNQNSTDSINWISGTAKDVTHSICHNIAKYDLTVGMTVLGVLLGVPLLIATSIYLHKRWEDGSIASAANSVSTRVGACCSYLSTPFRSTPQNDGPDSGFQYVQMKELEPTGEAQTA